jgi:hypothetical protein
MGETMPRINRLRSADTRDAAAEFDHAVPPSEWLRHRVLSLVRMKYELRRRTKSQLGNDVGLPTSRRARQPLPNGGLNMIRGKRKPE